MSNSDRRNRLYDLGREALRKLTGGEDVGYVCPICLNNFLQLQCLSEEHVPPHSVGGKVLCLTCQKCNSEAGHRIDAHVHWEQRSRSFMGSDGQDRRAKLVVVGSELSGLNVDTRKDVGGIHIQLLGEYNNPQAIEKFQSKDFPAGTLFQLRDRVSYSNIKANIGHLKSAYLAAFAKLGYAYILGFNLDMVRQQIRSSHSRLLEIVRLEARSGDEVEKALLLFQSPVHCLGVKMGNSIVCLPRRVDSDGFYENLQKKLQAMRATGRQETWQIDGSIDWPETFELALDFCGKYRIEVQHHVPADAAKQREQRG